MIQIAFRPLLISGMISGEAAGSMQLILIDSEQPESEQDVAVFHEALHLLFDAAGKTQLKNEDLIDAMAKAAAAAVPGIAMMLKR